MQGEVRSTPRQGVLHAIGNAHIDPVWLWRWNEGLEAIRATFRSALDRLEEFPDFVFTASSAAFFELLRRVDPGMLEEIRRRVREGRWEIAGGWWVEPDLNVPSGESLVRQALQGQLWFQEHLGVTARAGYNPDSFGHPRTLPQILKGAGLDFYVFLRPMPKEKELPENVFWWEGPDGSRVLASRITRAYCTWFDEMEEHVLINHEARPSCVRDYTVFYGVGDHGGGPTIANLRSLQRIAADPGMPEVRLSGLARYFQSLERDIRDGAAPPVVRDDLQHHARGCYSAHSRIKSLHRRAESQLFQAEILASLASTAAGRPWPSESLREAWRTLLFNEFHDILAGTSVREACEDACHELGGVIAAAARETHFAAQAIARQVDTRGEGQALLVFNPLPWPVRAPVEVEPASGMAILDADGQPVPAQEVQPEATVERQRRLVFVADLPPAGCALFRLTPGKPEDGPGADGVAAGEWWLENRFLRVEFDPATGEMTSLVGRRSGTGLLAGRGHRLLVLDDPGDTWSHDIAAFTGVLGAFEDASLAVEEIGPVRAAIRISSRWNDCVAVQRILLYRDLDFVECRLTLDWREPARIVKLAYPFALDGPEVTAESPYGFSEWPPDGEEHPCQRWVDVSGRTANGRAGVSLLNDCKHGFDCRGSELRLTLLRTPAYAHHDPVKLDPRRSYRYMDIGEHECVLRLVPHGGCWREGGIVRKAWELNVPPFYVNEYAHPGILAAPVSCAAVDHPGVIISTVKRAEDGDGIIVRAYESAGEEAGDVELRLPAAGVCWKAGFRACQIRTWRVRPGTPQPVVETDLLERPL